ncbi:hypothetical protein TrLO_g12876 [Triparma laevis f. longispina]|uniref:Xylose isomerase n=1 Tax=Triparma laevis f. longispina TaxID=1714387 RepID=A0A9W7FQL1_9STRA|nr:hypothetical protein TrLO_g12876 [Triparma laevis f. longispina]
MNGFQSREQRIQTKLLWLSSPVIMGKTMEEWCRFSLCNWHTFRGKGADPFGLPTMKRHFDDESNSMENAKRRIDAMFEMLIKLDIPYYTFHDRDVSPEGSTLEESNKMLDEIVDYLLAKQKETGVKLLWATQNLFSHPRYMNGGSTNPDATTFAYACAQAKKVIEINHKLGGENVVYWGGREGYQSVLNTDVKREMDHMGAFFKMCRDYRNKIISENVMDGMVKERYATFDSGFGKTVEEGTATLESAEAFAFKEGEPEQKSGKQEEYEMILNRYV